MVLIDMEKPGNCDNCPCSHWIITGENEGRLMCNVMEANMRENCLVDASSIPEGCPILAEGRLKDFEKWLEMMAEIRLDLN